MSDAALNDAHQDLKSQSANDDPASSVGQVMAGGFAQPWVCSLRSWRCGGWVRRGQVVARDDCCDRVGHIPGVEVAVSYVAVDGWHVSV